MVTCFPASPRAARSAPWPGRPVDLVGEHQVGEDRPLLGRKLAGMRRVDRGADDVGRQQIGGELDAREVELHAVGDGAHGQRLGQPRHALEQHVAAGEQPDEDTLDHVALTDDHLADLGGQAVDEGALLLDHLVDGPKLRLHRVRSVPCRIMGAQPERSRARPPRWDENRVFSSL
jgi:hypothetical protein